MIVHTLLSLAGIVLSEGNIWDTLQNMLEDTIEETIDDLSEESITDKIWDLVDMSDATVGTNVVLLDGFLTGVEINNFMEGMNSAMEDIMDEAGVTEGMNQTEIFNAVNLNGFNATEYGWDSGLDLENMLDNYDKMVKDMERLSFMEGMDLSGLTNLDETENMLRDFGYDGPYSMSDIEEDLDDVNISQYNTQMMDIQGGLVDVMSGSGDLDAVISDLEALQDSLQSDIDDGEVDLQESLDELTKNFDRLVEYSEDPSEALLDLAETVGHVFDETNFNYAGVTDELGVDWLGNFTESVRKITGNYEVCDDVSNIIQQEYSSAATFTANCIYNVVSCECLDGAGLYNNAEKKDVIDSLKCFHDATDHLTVEQKLRECNGVSVEIVDSMDAVETLGELATLMTEDNYEGITKNMNTSELSEDYSTALNSLEELEETIINADDLEEALEQVKGNVDNLLVDLGVNVTVDELVDAALDAVVTENDVKGKGKSVEWWAWLLISLAILGVILLICRLIQLRQKNTKLGNIASEVELEEGQEGQVNTAGEALQNKPIEAGTSTLGEM